MRVVNDHFRFLPVIPELSFSLTWDLANWDINFHISSKVDGVDFEN